MERTLMFLKPDAWEKGLLIKILSMIRETNLSGKPPNIIGMKLIPRVSPEIARAHYAEHEGKDFFPWLVDQITSGPIVALAISGPNIIDELRQLAGATDPAKASPSSIRGKFSNDSLEASREEGRATNNVVHTAENAEAAERELAIWFRPDELIP